ncbi:uncharacterized protein EV154DRAFT_485788 [Mucor mucedo]|uniref:uncharacterized protein n=1 Tax=Mucor mucedo TaxID=29922 RepID=UPI00222123EA|nr:uncharacterized protein EV154DRAFT_485788 [Mucor mucedo]KAI7881206.1 hypothetical protein EV154DRAFT_485788 [Mucor mucedo]
MALLSMLLQLINHFCSYSTSGELKMNTYFQHGAWKYMFLNIYYNEEVYILFGSGCLLLCYDVDELGTSLSKKCSSFHTIRQFSSPFNQVVMALLSMLLQLSVLRLAWVLNCGEMKMNTYFQHGAWKYMFLNMYYNEEVYIYSLVPDELGTSLSKKCSSFHTIRQFSSPFNQVVMALLSCLLLCYDVDELGTSLSKKCSSFHTIRQFSSPFNQVVMALLSMLLQLNILFGSGCLLLCYDVDELGTSLSKKCSSFHTIRQFSSPFNQVVMALLIILVYLIIFSVKCDNVEN